MQRDVRAPQDIPVLSEQVLRRTHISPSDIVPIAPPQCEKKKAIPLLASPVKRKIPNAAPSKPLATRGQSIAQDHSDKVALLADRKLLPRHSYSTVY
jgi:hypothetical protein